MDNWLNYGASIPQHATCNNLNEPQGNYAELVKKSISKGYILYDSFYVSFV